jgi:ribosome-binding protein aMBF1 (putative translation factor)
MMTERVDGSVVREGRRLVGLSADRLAKQLGCTSRAIERNEARRMRTATAVRYLDAIEALLASRSQQFAAFRERLPKDLH